MPLRSMTGYGIGEAPIPEGRVVVEIRGVNHRYTDLTVRLPKDLASLEERVRAAVLAKVLRGRVEVVIMKDEASRRPEAFRADIDLARSYVRALGELARTLGLEGTINLAMVASLPGVIRLEEDRQDAEALWPAISTALEKALGVFVQMREEEGARLARDLLERIWVLEEEAEAIARRAPAVVEEYANRLRRRVSELLGDVSLDEGRLAMEAMLFAERSDISEELVRIRSHLTQFRQTIETATGAVGRKLDFILQELFREVNTIGAKANDLEISHRVISMKSELESLREQVQNIE
ncbi:MAG: YicC/YloC family endoribonuclease [Armatimonadota bacterium]|nr:YicC/YloC family endoribonuclease [Armatimonadota bacterium]MDR5703561.1 YicC/YloC family endoribonuclease [Armatimonadota bacterium]